MNEKDKKKHFNREHGISLKVKPVLFFLKIWLSWFVSRIKKNFFYGLIVILPLGATVLIVWKIFEIVKSLFTNLFAGSIPWWIGMAITFGLILFIGYFAKFTQNIFTSRIVKFFTNLINKLPLVKNLYGTLKQLVDIIFSKPKMVFNKVVLIEYPRREIWCLAFVTETAPQMITDLAEEKKMVSVFLPTTPNPTSGFLLFIREEDVHKVDMSVEDAMKLIISGGMLTPENINKLNPVSPEEAHNLELEEKNADE
jgi:uncharacterized membrane protein